MNTKRIDYDIVVIGSGPAGLQAALHAIQRKVSVAVAGKLHKSSAYASHIENFLSIEGKSGMDLLQQARLKVDASGVVFYDEDITHISRENQHFVLTTESGFSIKTLSVILAMGISRNRLGLKNEKTLLGKGVSYCVDCDAGFFRDQNVVIIGGESAAITGALTLLFYANTVHLVCEKLDTSDYLAEQLEKSDVIVHEGCRPVDIIGEEAVSGLVLNDGTTLDVSGIFIELGAKGIMELAGNLGVAMDPEKTAYITTNKKQETNIPGIYAAGDICGPPWQVPKAVGEGCVAGLEAAAYVKKTGKL